MDTNQIGRRSFMTLLCTALAAAPLPARAQQAPPSVVGVLAIGSSGGEHGPVWDAWRKALGQAGFIEGRNLRVEFNWADSASRLPDLAKDLVGRRVDVIFALSGLAARAAKAATASIPIVFAGAVGPVGLGLVESLQHPGGNVTGIANVFNGLTEERLKLLHELAPAASRIGYLFNPENSNPANGPDQITSAARTLRIEIIVLPATKPEEIGPVITSGDQKKIGGIVISDDPVLNAQQGQVVEQATRYALPVITNGRAGGVLDYGPDLQDTTYRAGAYVARVLKGEKPADLPVGEATRSRLVINLKAAKALGLTIPQSLLARADEVIK